MPRADLAGGVAGHFFLAAGAAECAAPVGRHSKGPRMITASIAPPARQLEQLGTLAAGAGRRRSPAPEELARRARPRPALLAAARMRPPPLSGCGFPAASSPACAGAIRTTRCCVRFCRSPRELADERRLRRRSRSASTRPCAPRACCRSTTAARCSSRPRPAPCTAATASGASSRTRSRAAMRRAGAKRSPRSPRTPRSKRSS